MISKKVITTIAISSVLTIASGGISVLNMNTVEAATVYQDEQALYSNLLMTTKIIQARVKNGQLDIAMLTNMCNRLASIEAKLIKDKKFSSTLDFATAIKNAYSAVDSIKVNNKVANYQEYINKQNQAKQAIFRIYVRMSGKEIQSQQSQQQQIQQETERLTQNIKLDFSKNQTIGKVTVIASKQPAVVGNIKTLYGTHTYGCKTQAEYDYVMKAIREELLISGKKQISEYYEAYYKGDRASNYKKFSQKWSYLTTVEKNVTTFMIKMKMSKPQMEAYQIACGVIASYGLATKTLTELRDSSAYDVIANKIAKCDSNAQLRSAVLDSLGYTTMVVAKDGDAKCLVKVNGHWYIAGMESLGVANTNSVDGYISQPTYQ